VTDRPQLKAGLEQCEREISRRLYTYSPLSSRIAEDEPRMAMMLSGNGIALWILSLLGPSACQDGRNSNGLLHQYFPKGTDLNVYSAEHL
jgi:hypothetical protein